MKIALGSDHAGYELKDFLAGHLRGLGMEVEDLGGHAPEAIDYPVVGERVALAIVGGKADLGIAICGTGIGIGIAANKVPGIRCVICSEPYSAKLSRQHNNCNMLALGARVVGDELAAMIVDEWLAASFNSGHQRHVRRVEMLGEIERKYSCKT